MAGQQLHHTMGQTDPVLRLTPLESLSDRLHIVDKIQTSSIDLVHLPSSRQYKSPAREVDSYLNHPESMAHILALPPEVSLGKLATTDAGKIVPHRNSLRRFLKR
jgi:hypothetical protein